MPSYWWVKILSMQPIVVPSSVLWTSSTHKDNFSQTETMKICPIIIFWRSVVSWIMCLYRSFLFSWRHVKAWYSGRFGYKRTSVYDLDYTNTCQFKLFKVLLMFDHSLSCSFGKRVVAARSSQHSSRLCPGGDVAAMTILEYISQWSN